MRIVRQLNGQLLQVEAWLIGPGGLGTVRLYWTWRATMLSREALEAYRRMTPSQRLALTFQAMRESIPYLLAGPPEIVDRRFELIRRENDLRNRNMLEALANAERRNDQP
jgi:hypothetical protein